MSWRVFLFGRHVAHGSQAGEVGQGAQHAVVVVGEGDNVAVEAGDEAVEGLGGTAGQHDAFMVCDVQQLA